VWSRFDLLAPSLDVVASVRSAGTPCYLATNQDVLRAVRMRERTPYDDVLDGAYYSCDIGVAKPAGAFFEHIAADLGLAPDRLLFVDDQPRNIAGARSAGLRAEQWTHDAGIPRLRDILTGHGVHLDRAGPATDVSVIATRQPPASR
jgi:putative hydrolase of the HAD superfamily